MKKPQAPIRFSVKTRTADLAECASRSWDLIIIGGGITGAGIALDAASRGLSTLIVEKGDFASGTSSKSTKLIHGGLRYLKQFDFWLVKEVGSERAIVHKLAPHLVIPEKMLLPLIEGGSYGKWLTSIGLKVYDILAQVSGDDKRQMLEKKPALKKEPLLPKKRLKGAGYYAEYRTDDARLTLENIKTALSFGAKALNYAEVSDFVYDKNKQVSGVRLTDKLTNVSLEISGKYVVNAAGPWVDELRGINHSRQGKRLHLTKGVHLVFPYEKLPVKQSVYFDVPDGRMIFAIPRGKITYVGTTDTHYTKDKDRVTTDLADAIYLISAVNNMFPDIELDMSDIESSWAGLRPLIHEEGKSASELSRKDEIFISDTGLLSIAGGKLTGYRKMAERIVDRVAKLMEEQEGKKLKANKTHKIPLCGNGFKDYNGVKSYRTGLKDRLKATTLSKEDRNYLVATYGIQTDEILERFEAREETDDQLKLILAEVSFALDYEMIHHPEDFFIRRTGKMYFDINSVRHYADEVSEYMASELGKTKVEAAAWKAALQEQITHHSDFSMAREAKATD